MRNHEKSHRRNLFGRNQRSGLGQLLDPHLFCQRQNRDLHNVLLRLQLHNQLLLTMYFNEKEAVEVFRKTWLEGEYNFLTEDLVKLGDAFAKAAEAQIAKKEREECIKFVNSLNTHVAKALQEKRAYG